VTALAALLAAAALATSGPSGPYGSGAAQVWVLRPAGPIRHVVVFAHGWKVAPPASASAWVEQFRPWLNHLLTGGGAVIFPRYQLGGSDPYDSALVRAFEAGVRTGYARLGRPSVPVIAVGYSVGAALVLAYGAEAPSLGLPVPAAIDAIFPAGPVPGAPLPALGRTIRVLIQVGDEDTIAGTAGARAFWTWLAPHPAARRTYRVVRSAGSFHVDHAAPKLATAAARSAFWAPLDRLIPG
jgi:hypothetical protein